MWVGESQAHVTRFGSSGLLEFRMPCPSRVQRPPCIGRAACLRVLEGKKERREGGREGGREADVCDGGAGDSRAFSGRRVFAASASMLRAPCIEMHRCACVEGAVEVEGAVGIVAEASVLCTHWPRSPTHGRVSISARAGSQNRWRRVTSLTGSQCLGRRDASRPREYQNLEEDARASCGRAIVRSCDVVRVSISIARRARPISTRALVQ